WLTATAFLHSVMIQERRRMLQLWNLALVIMTFGLTLFGTFLTRSGVIASVHAFTQGTIGAFFLGFLTLVLLTALGLLAWRWDALGAQGALDSVVSRESAFLLNNVMLVAAAFTVFFAPVFVAARIALDFARATRVRARMGEPLLPAMGGLLRRHNRRYGGFVVHLGVLIIAVGVTGSQAWSVQTETTLGRGESTELAGYR